MSVTIHIPTPLRPYAGNSDSVELLEGTVDEVLERLTNMHPKLRHHLFQEDGSLRSFVNIYVNDRDTRDLERGATATRDGDDISIVPLGQVWVKYPWDHSGRPSGVQRGPQ